LNVQVLPMDSLSAQLAGRSVALVGMMGVGKTNVGRRLATRLGLPFRDADAEIERDAGRSIAEMFAHDGETEFRRRERRVIARLLADVPIVLATGGGAFMDAQTRRAMQDKAVSIWLRCDLPLLLRRLAACTDRPLLRNGDPAEVLQRLMMLRHPVYAEADLALDSVDEDPDATTARVHAALRSLPDRLAAALQDC
jgi:shikimate kinase/3-dehydroquinate synthase